VTEPSDGNWPGFSHETTTTPLYAGSGSQAVIEQRRLLRRRQARRRRRRRRRLLIVAAVLALLSPVFYSYVSTMVQPSSLPLGIRTVEWLRQHHGNWIVDEAESIYYRWNAPKNGGPQLKVLPAVGLAVGTPLRSSN
jgi:predicted DNA-binding transcriptional regulator AlpA